MAARFHSSVRDLSTLLSVPSVTTLLSLELAKLSYWFGGGPRISALYRAAMAAIRPISRLMGRGSGQQVQEVPEEQRRHPQDAHDLCAVLRREALHRQRSEPEDDANLRERAEEIQGPYLFYFAGVRPQQRYSCRARDQPEDHDGQVAGNTQQEERAEGRRSRPRPYSPWAAATTTKNAP